MSGINKILIAIDDESNENIAIQLGLALASVHSAKIIIFAVLKNTDELVRSLSNIIPKEELSQHFFEHHRTRIENIVSNNPNHTDITIEIATGVPFVETIRKAFAVNADIILQSSHPLEQEHLFFSSSDWHLMRKSPFPVWIIKNKEPLIPREIMVAIDVMNKPEDTSFNKNILTLAVEIAHYSNARLTVFSTWQLFEEKTLSHNPFIKISSEQIENLLKNTAAIAKEKQNELEVWLHKNTSINRDKVTWHIEKGNAREVIPKFANEHNFDLLIMGTINRTGIPGLLIGNTAETVLSEIRCSVVTMKPSSFKGPINIDST